MKAAVKKREAELHTCLNILFYAYAENPQTPIVMTNQAKMRRGQSENIFYSFNKISYTVHYISKATKHNAYQWERLSAISLFFNLPYDVPEKRAK